MFTAKDMQAAEQLRRALQMYAGTLTEAQAREVATVYPHWEAGKNYLEGKYLTNGTDDNGDPILYKVAQAHTSSKEWLPSDNPALYTCISMSDTGYPIWSQPTGAQDAYNTGDIVSYNGKLYKSMIDGNTTKPGSDERWWEEYTTEV